jgi:hypothetical protein
LLAGTRCSSASCTSASTTISTEAFASLFPLLTLTVVIVIYA